MKDAAQPVRLLDGSSVYQDRILYTAIAIIISGLVSLFLTDRVIEVIGNSGDVFKYSTNDYIGFISINFIVLSVAVGLMYVIFRENIQKSTLSREIFVAAIIFVVLNETTKTYMFTPHSQLFNVLLPVWIIYLCQQASKSPDKSRFILLLFVTFFFALNYKLFVVAFVPIFFIGKRVLGNIGILFTVLSLGGVILLPRTIIEIMGGTFDNYDVSHYRTIVWILDIVKGDSSPSLFLSNFFNFVGSIPIIPLVALFCLVPLCWNLLASSENTLQSRLVLCAFLSYFTLLSILGFSARRLTLSLISIALIWFLFCLASEVTKGKKLSFIVRSSIVGQILMWALTMGPLA